MESSDSFDEEDGILKKALDVELPEDFNPHKVPQTGEEYVQHVIYERSKCKRWITAEIDRSKFKNKQTFKIELGSVVKGAASPLLPSKTWQIDTIKNFMAFRKYIHSKIQAPSTISSFDEDKFLHRTQTESPQFSELVAYTQAAKIRMLQIISKYMNSVPPGQGLGRDMGVWIYGILVLLEKPLSPDWCHTIREFSKKCLLIRQVLQSAGFSRPLKTVHEKLK